MRALCEPALPSEVSALGVVGTMSGGNGECRVMVLHLQGVGTQRVLRLLLPPPSLALLDAQQLRRRSLLVYFLLEERSDSVDAMRVFCQRSKQL